MSLDYDDEYDAPVYRPSRGRLKSSGLGIASFIISVLAGLEIISLLIVGMVMEIRTPGWADEDSPQVMFLRLLVIIMSLVGLVLGITGLVQGGRSKVFPVLGLGFNGMIILGVIGIIIIGVLSG